MIAFACASLDERAFRAHAAPSIERAAENSSLLMRRHGIAAIGDAFNEMLDQAGAEPDLEAVVLMHERGSIERDDFASRVRGLLAGNPQTGIAVRTAGDRLDGNLIVFSPWAAANLRFEPRAPHASAEELANDIADKVRAAGREVAAGDL